MCDNRRFDARRGGWWCDERHATCDARTTIDASTRDAVVGGATSDTRHATRGRQSTLRRATRWLVVRRATRDMRRADDNRRFDARQEEQPFSKSNILSEPGQRYLPFWGKERGEKREY